MGLVRIRATIVTTHPVSAYGGVQLPESQVEKVAKAVASGTIPMRIQHDAARPLASRNLEAGTERLADGHLGAWVEFDVEEGSWDAYMSEVTAAGAPGGWSVSFTEPLDGEPHREALVSVAADAHHFSDAEIRAAVEALRGYQVQAQGARLYQFAFEPTSAIALYIAWEAVVLLGPNLIASAIYDAGKAFFAHSRADGVTLNVTLRDSRKGRRRLDIKIEAADAAQMRAALDGLPDVLASEAVGTFVSTSGSTLEALLGGDHEDSNDATSDLEPEPADHRPIDPPDPSS